MRIFRNWLLNRFKQQSSPAAFGRAVLATRAEQEDTQLALKHYRLQQLKELDKRFSSDEAAHADPHPQPKSFDSAKHHWFEFSSGRRAPKEHQGKQVQVASDTWNRLSSSMQRIEERLQAQRDNKSLTIQ